MAAKLTRHKYLKNVYYDSSKSTDEIELTKQRNSQPDDLEIVGNVFLNAKGEKHVLITFLADIHYGGQCFNRKKFMKVLNFAKTTNSYVSILGDSLDLATASSATNVQTYQTNNEKSQKALQSDLELIKEQILQIVPGNHTSKQGNRIKDLGICMERPIAEHLGCPYFPYHVLLDIITGEDKHYYIGLTHGDLANDYQTVADKLIKVIRAETGVIVDAVAMGHYHSTASYDRVYEYTTFDEETNTYVKAHKTITVESMPAFQETNEFAVTKGQKKFANSKAFDFILDDEGNIINVISFNILDEKGEYTQMALRYQEQLKIIDKETFMNKLRKKFAKKLLNAKTENAIIKIAQDMVEGE